MRPTHATVRLSAVSKNYSLACQKSPGSKSIAVIKANAYGHGMIKVARQLEDQVPAFAVVSLDEAVQLRDAGILKPVLILQGVNRAEEIDVAAAMDFWLMLHQRQQAELLASANPSAPVRAWVKLDTGMHRLGVAADDLDRLCAQLASTAHVEQGVVLCTHLACADDPENPMTSEQVRSIRSCAGRHQLPLSIANSAGILFWPESHAEWNRPGYMLYGNCPTGAYDAGSAGLHPAMTMNSEIIAIRHLAPGEGVGYGLDWVAKRPSSIGTIAIGYGDGYPRHAPSGTPVLVKGQRVSLVGRVSMDAIGVDLTDLENVEVGDPVELWGQNLSVNEVAAAAGTIGYEILAGLTGRVPVEYQS
jgi:alanine racemase